MSISAIDNNSFISYTLDRLTSVKILISILSSLRSDNNLQNESLLIPSDSENDK